MRRAWQLLAIVIAVAALSPAVQAYLKLGVTANGQVVALRWGQLPIRYFVTDAGVPGVTASQFREAVGRAFQTWHSVPSAAVDFSFVGFTGAEPGDQDNASTLGFVEPPGSRAHARGDELSRRHAHRRDARVGHLLQLVVLVVGRRCRRAREVRRPVACHARDRPLHRPRPLGDRRDHARQRRPSPADCRGHRDVPDCVRRRRHQHATAACGRHRRRLRSVSREHVSRRHRNGSGHRDEGRQGRLRRARHGVQPGHAARSSAGSRSTRAAPSPSPGCLPARTSSASSRWTTATPRATSTPPSTSTPISEWRITRTSSRCRPGAARRPCRSR